ncbi:MAG: hypothetical protein KOO61_02325 [Spirochaetales bacterium]|nr:hypothetical protein [Spirochaetales bacterium]
MKLRRFWILLAAILLIAVFVIFFTDLVGIDLAPFLPKVRLQSSETWSSSTVTLEAVRDLYAFNTVEYVHRSVFPYDYLPEDVSLTEILAKLRTADSTVKETLSANEYLYFQTYNLAVDIGMDLSGRRDFVIVTVVVTAGFDLAGFRLAEPSEPDAADDAAEVASGLRVETISTPDGDILRAVVSPPSPTITEIRVEDIVGEEYPYPDISIGADGWRRVAEFVEEQVMGMPEIADLLTIAGANGQDFVRDVLLRAGYGDVIFEQL